MNDRDRYLDHESDDTAIHQAAADAVANQQAPDDAPMYYCEDCDEFISEKDTFFEETLSPGRKWVMWRAHEGGETTIGGDGYGDKCCAEMDVPICHFVNPDPDFNPNTMYSFCANCHRDWKDGVEVGKAYGDYPELCEDCAEGAMASARRDRKRRDEAEKIERDIKVMRYGNDY